MANLFNNQFNNLRLELNNSEYWDFFLNKDSNCYNGNLTALDKSLYEECLASYIDLSDSSCIDVDDIVGKKEYEWKKSVSTPYILTNVGYTGLDNGLISFERDRIDNKQFLGIYQNSTYNLIGEKVLRLHKVNGGTKIYDYPSKIENDSIKLNGGLYQGFFKTECNKYQILPTSLENGDVWNLEFVLKKEDFEKESNKTLNDKYPNNKGIFFYIGTRAENKWDYLYSKDKEDNSSIDSYVDDSEFSEWCKTNAFVDMEIDDDFTEWESEAIDDYLSFKYYNDELYNIENDGLEDFFYDKDKPNIIDENSEHSVITCWCKGQKCKETIKKLNGRIVCCCPSKCRKIETEKTIEEENYCEGYLTKCEQFDLIEDFDEIDDGIDYIEDDIDISDFEFQTSDGFTLKIGNQWFLDTDNKFLLFDKTCNGYTINTYNEGDIVRYSGVKNDFKGNLFLLMDKTPNGYIIDTINQLKESYIKEYNVVNDIVQNALAFRITDKGQIGYRYIISDCESENGYKIIEGYSVEDIIKENRWHTVSVKIKGFFTTMALEFYVDGKLIFLTKEMPKLNLRELNDLAEKQETVPYNISLGGGTQGLCDTILPNYMRDPYRVYPLEENFAGTFIGYIQKFRFYTCELGYNAIFNNYMHDLAK